MATDQSFVDFVVDQIAQAGDVKARKMFGEYGLHCDGKFISIIAQNQFFLKPTDAGRDFIGQPQEAPPYPGANNYFLIQDKLEDQDWMIQLVKITTAALPDKKNK